MKTYSELKKQLEENYKDKSGTVEMTVPLFIRMLEYAREDAKSDKDLHKATENLMNLNKCADMFDYDKIVRIK